MPEPLAVLDIGGGAEPAQFPALLMPNDYVIVGGMPINRLREVAASRVLIRSAANDRTSEHAVGTAAMRVFPDPNAETAVVLVKLELAVAAVSIPESTGNEFPALMERHGHDVVEALRAGGITAQLLPQPWKPPVGHRAGRPQPPYGWTPLVPPGAPGYPHSPTWGICCWLHWSCCSDPGDWSD